MKILVKYPTRQRPDLFLKTLKGYVDKAVSLEQIDFLISFDLDDETMNNQVLSTASKLASSANNYIIQGGYSTSKIDACNRDIELMNDWDILLLVSDDMECIADGWDERIRVDMKKFFPDTDGCLWYHDGAQMSICTLSIIGRKYYDKFKYIYHPSYKSFFCDNEFTEIAKHENKIQLISRMIVKHQHPSWGGSVGMDELYKRNDKYWIADESNYHIRKANGWK